MKETARGSIPKGRLLAWWQLSASMTLPQPPLSPIKSLTHESEYPVDKLLNLDKGITTNWVCDWVVYEIWESGAEDAVTGIAQAREDVGPVI